jgi:Cu+-exporting ATPase
MALERADAAPVQDANAELTSMTRRFMIGAALAVPLVALEMAGHLGLLPADRYFAAASRQWVEFALATPIVFWCAAPFFERAATSVRIWSLNMFTLIALGVGVSYGYSVVAVLAPGWFPPELRAAGGIVPDYLEAAAVVTVLVLLGQVLELRARAKTGGAMRALLQLAPKSARRIGDDGVDTQVPIADVKVGDRLRVRPGEAMPVDGVVTGGGGGVDESMVTGEAMPVVKAVGAAVIGGTINGRGALVIEARQVGADTLLAHIVSKVAAAERSRAPIQRLADTVAAWFVPAVIAAAVIAFAAWMIWAPAPALGFAIVAAVSVLVVACPCALGLATPMSIMVGIGRAASVGVLVKNAEALERFEKVDTLVIDKTGTLTEGRPRVTAIVTAGSSMDEAGVLSFAAGLERSSEHPLGAAILTAAHDRGLTLEAVSQFVSVTGKGVMGTIDGRRVAVGNAALFKDLGVTSGELEAPAEAQRQQGATALFVAIDGQAAGLIAIADPIKPTTRGALDALRTHGLRVVMLTGDHVTTARWVAAQLGIDEVDADVLPDQKSAVVRRLQQEGRIVAMAGDGVNDAPALAAADVGIAMGTGTDVAMQSAGLTLVKGDLSGLVRARTLSVATMRNIRENLGLAFAYNAVGIPVAAGALYPAFGILSTPILSAAAMSFSSVCVIANALRLRSTTL